MNLKIDKIITAERPVCLQAGSCASSAARPRVQAPWAFFASLGLMVAMGSATSFAQDASPPANSLAERAAVSSARQVRIREETAKATVDLTRIIDEFDRNGLGDDQDAKMLRAVRDTLNKLTDSQMQQVLALLDQARSAQTDDAAKTHSASAFAEQRQIYAAMQKTLLAFQQQADLLDLSIQFSELANRQNANFKQTKHLALKSMNSRELDEGRLAELHVQQTEQDAIQVEVSARLDKLASLMKAVEPETAAQLSAAMQQVTPATLEQSLSASSSELRLAHMTKATSVELSSYKMLREFSRLAKPPREPEQVLADAADQLGITIKGYGVLITDTATAHHNENDENRMLIDDEQGDLVDDVSDISKDIQTLAPEAFGTLSDAKDKMQEARAASLGGVDQQKRLLPELIAARQQILDELKRRQLMAQMADADTKQQRAEAVRDELNQLADKQKQIMAETHKAHSEEETAKVSTRQATVTDELKALSPAVAKELPELAQAVDKAAETSQQANDRLVDNKPREALDPQQQTIDALAGAQKQADAAAVDLEQKAQELQQLQQTKDDIAKVANAQQALAVQTAVAAAKDQSAAKPNAAAKGQAAADASQNTAKPDAAAQAADPLKTAAPTAEALGNDQQALAKATQNLQAGAPADAPDAAEPLKQAAQQMDAAAKQLGNNAPAPAQTPQQGAIASLLKAQDAVNKKMDQLAQQLGEQPDPNANLDAAGQEVQQALQNTADAQASMQQKKGEEAGQELKGAAEHAANAEDQGTLPQAAQQDLAQAHQELGAAAAAHAGGNEPGAGQHAAAAAGLLQQAMQQIQQGQAKGEGKGTKKGEQWKPGQMANGDPPKTVHPAHIDANGDRDHVTGGSNFNGLPARDRAAITQSGSEPAPAQYQSMVQQYMKNLADDRETPAK